MLSWEKAEKYLNEKCIYNYIVFEFIKHIIEYTNLTTNGYYSKIYDVLDSLIPSADIYGFNLNEFIEQVWDAD